MNYIHDKQLHHTQVETYNLIFVATACQSHFSMPLPLQLTSELFSKSRSGFVQLLKANAKTAPHLKSTRSTFKLSKTSRRNSQLPYKSNMIKPVGFLLLFQGQLHLLHFEESLLRPPNSLLTWYQQDMDANPIKHPPVRNSPWLLMVLIGLWGLNSCLK